MSSRVRSKSKYHAQIADCNGQPALFVNGQPIFLGAPYLQKAPYESFVSARTGIYFAHDHFYPVAEDGTVDIAHACEEVDKILAKEPKALIILRSFPAFPRWWLDQNPDEEVRYDRDLSKCHVEEPTRDASWASDPWLNASAGWYEDWCGQLHQVYDGQVIGHQFGMGVCGENGPIGACALDGRWFCADFSPAMHRYFRAWLKRKYRTVDALRKGWSRPEVTFETAEVPDRIERLRTDWFTFRSPQKAQVADYYLAFAERVGHCVIAFCEAIKRGTNGECIAGSHLGAIMDQGYHGYIYHQAVVGVVRHALAHPAVDMFTSPPSYENRSPGGDSNSMMAVGSVLLHGKTVFQDQDTPTCVLPEGFREKNTLGTIAADLRETIDTLKRDFGHILVRGHGLFWHSCLTKGMFNHPEVSACIAKLTEIGKKSLRFPRGIAEDGVAMIVDEESVFHQECANRLYYPMLYYQRQHCWGRSGVPWNVYLHNDLAHPKMPDHKLYYFLSTFYLTDAEIVEIEKKVKRNGATVIWTYAPGIQSPAGFSLERVERLTGFKLKAVDIQALPRVTEIPSDHPYVQHQQAPVYAQYVSGANEPSFFGTGPGGNDAREGVIGPIIYVEDPDATVLGELDCLQQPGFCVKAMDGWTSVFCAAPMLNQYILRNVARASGVHVYSEGDDVILPGKSFLMIHAKKAGQKVIRLPAPADVYECYDGYEVGRSITEIRETLPEHGTRLYFLGDMDAYRG